MDVAILALEDGAAFVGRPFGARGETDGEVVFNTSTTGHRGIVDDPANRGLIVVMTCSDVGDFDDDRGDRRPWLRGFVAPGASPRGVNRRAEESLSAYLADRGVVGLTGIDARALARHLRVHGSMKGVVSSIEADDAVLIARARDARGVDGLDLTGEVMPAAATVWAPGPARSYRVAPLGGERLDPEDEKRPRVVVLDFGMRRDAPGRLVDLGLIVTVVSGRIAPEAVMEHQPDGVFLSDGPGDPSALGDVAASVRTLVKAAAESRGVPILGVGLGCQLLGMAFGARTLKLKFGHRGASVPVRDLAAGKVAITNQNHGFAIDPSTLPGDVAPSHVNLNDGTLEGLRHQRLPIVGVQFHPESAVGSHDNQHVFDDFRAAVG